MIQLSDRLDQVNRLTGLAIRWLVLAMLVIQFAIVLLRYVFGISSIAANESVLYLHATLFMLGAGYTLLKDDHVRVDIFYARAGRHVRAAIDVVGHLLLLIPAMGVLLVWSWPMVRNSWAIREGAISVGGIPAVYLLKTLVPVFCGLLIVQSVSCLLRAATTARRRA